MARYLGSKNKIARRFGEDLGLKSSALKLNKRLGVRPGQHGLSKMRRRLSDYGVQLREKQKVKYIYGILEKQITKLYKEATSASTSTGLMILIFLERRLDNIVYRSGWTQTRAQARQFVSHNHILVNGKKVNIPSYRVRIDDVVEIKKKALNIPFIKESLKNNVNVNKTNWLEVKGSLLKVKFLPEREDIKENINEQLIVEFYSR